MHNKAISSILDVNLPSTYFLINSATRFMMKNGGYIIYIKRIAANIGFPVNPAFISSKAELKRLTRSLSYDFAHLDIRLNSLVPSYFKTDITKKNFYAPLRVNRSLLMRWGEFKELMIPAIFLLSKSSSFIIGTVLIVDYGWSFKLL